MASGQPEAGAAPALNYRGFSAIDGRFTSLENRFTSLETRLDRRLYSMQADMKDLNKAMTALEVDIAILKDKAGV